MSAATHPLANPTPPARLYKYREIDDKGRLKAIITSSEMYLPSPLQLNDPFDCRFRLIFEGNERQRQKFCEAMVRQNYPSAGSSARKKLVGRCMAGFRGMNAEHHQFLNAEKLVNSVLERQRLCSMAKNNDDMLMWSHYTKAHTGVCLEFSNVAASGLGIFRPVQYRNAPVVINPMALTRGEYRGEIGFEVCLRKSLRWEYEEEWRSVILWHGPPAVHLKRFNPDCLTGVILGCRIASGDEKQVRNWITKRETPLALYRAVPKTRDYGLSIVGAK